MEHPFAPDLSDKSIEELQDSIIGLTSKLMFAFRTGNQPIIHQLQMLIESYRKQYNTKMDEMFSKQQIGNKINVSKSADD